MSARGRVFISYRRDGAAELARNIRDALSKRRFLDVISGSSSSTGARVVLVHNFADELIQQAP